MDHICTWFCADEKGEESLFPQTGEMSSGKKHQAIYWRCVLLFFTTSRRYNLQQKHVFYTNVKVLPIVDGRNIHQQLRELKVEVVYTGFNYKTPKGYFGMFQNQFYEFSILEHIAQHNPNPADNYLILDSDCIFIKPAAALFDEAKEQGFLSFEDDCTTALVIHGLSRRDMKNLYEELLQQNVGEIPGYHLGEFFLASAKNIRQIFAGFLELWPELIYRHEQGLPKFNEEAQTLSYLYYKNGFKASPRRDLMKRIWTNPVFYRDAALTDTELVVWHLPAEKTYGLADLHEMLIKKPTHYTLDIPEDKFLELVQQTLGIPQLSVAMKLNYYFTSYYRAIRKRIKKRLSV